MRDFNVSTFKYQAALFILSLLILVSSFLYPVAAQQTPLEKAESDYTFQFTKYQDTKDKYLTAKDSYLAFQTAIAKNDAYIKSRDYLIQVDQLYITFIFLVNENANALNWVTTDQDKNKFTQLLDDEKNYFLDNQKKLQATKTLEEIPPIAQDIKDHVTNILEPKLNKALIELEIVQSEATLSDFNILASILGRVVATKIVAGDTKSILNNWSSEIKDIRDKTQSQINQAKKVASQTEDQSANISQLQQVAQNTAVAKDNLRRSKALFNELITVI